MELLVKHSIRLDVYNDNHDVFNKAFSEGVNKISGMLLFLRLKKTLLDIALLHRKSRLYHEFI